MITLAIDTSTPHGSIALLADGTLLLQEIFVSERSHSALLFAALEKARTLAEHVDQIAIGLGPGSYAGVRIAIAAALGLRLAFDAKLVGIPSVAALDTATETAVGASWPTQYIVIGDARRDSFYFSQIENGVCTIGPLLATEAELREKLSTTTLPIYATEPVPHFPEAQIAQPSAVKLAILASTNTGITATDNFEPIYLREPHITQPKKPQSLLPRQS
jgi:tRNA threonylcarbamoyl adenosine modification protein YeaZ